MKLPPPRRTTTAQKLTRARVRLVLEQAFFGTLALRLKLVPGSLPTMATDGSRIVYNPAFVDQLKPAELEGTLAHEVLHCALGHQCRRGERDPELWNQAADFAINPILLGNGFTLPAGALVDPAFKNLSAEEISPDCCRAGAVVAVRRSRIRSRRKGSIGKRELEQFAGEISAISEEAKPEAIHPLTRLSPDCGIANAKGSS